MKQHKSKKAVSIGRNFLLLGITLLLFVAFVFLFSTFPQHHDLDTESSLKFKLQQPSRQSKRDEILRRYLDQSTPHGGSTEKRDQTAGKLQLRGHPESKDVAKSPIQSNSDASLSNSMSKDVSHPVKFASNVDKLSLGLDTMLLIICANRPEYLQKTLEAVAKYHPIGELPIFVSQDGDDARVTKIIKGTFLHLQQSNPGVRFIHKHHAPSGGRSLNGYYKLAAHYKWALDFAFSDPTIKRVIILEEDLVIAPDFFELFAATKTLLDEDKNLLAVSAWNDNGFDESVKDSQQLYRSDFFPGLGWMLPRRIWTELGPKWPQAYWDDWLREPKNRQGRQILRPEISRTLHIGQRGVSNAQYSNYLHSMKLNADFVAFRDLDLSYLESSKWDSWYLNQVRSAKLISYEEAKGGQGLLNARKGGYDVRVVYDKFEGGGNSFASLASWSGAMNNIKAGVPRTAYKGIVSLWKGGTKVHLVPRSFS